MVKRFFGHICLILATVLILCSLGVYAADTPDNKVGLEIKFDYDKYVVGETAEATIKLTGLNDEKAAKYSLSAFQTQLEFNTDELEAVSMDFSEPLKSKIGTAEKYFNVTSKHSDIIAVLYAVDDGIALDDTIAPNGEITIGTINFEIKKTSGDISIGFETTSYKTEIIRPFEDSPEGYLLNCNRYANGSAKVVGAVLEPGKAVLDDSKVKAEGLRAVTPGNKGVLIAQLYDPDTKLTKATQIVDDLSKSYTISFDVSNITIGAKLEVRYYLWDSFLGMRALTEGRTVMLNN
ncbi:MAG: hypothetical protein EGR16_07090 [Clostridiales bacterium]|nr:hypothetical protein [Clostridiales bacterium]